MVSVLASSVVDRGFELQSGQTKYYIKLVIVAFREARSIKEKEQRLIDWLGIRIMCPNRATSLSANCCFSGLSLCSLGHM